MNIAFNNTGAPDIIELKSITQSYGDGPKVIDGLNLLIEEKPGQGQINALLGPSGCGKSTILKYIAGLQTPTSGDVLLYGQARTRDQHVGMVFQSYSPIAHYKVWENVALSLDLGPTADNFLQKLWDRILRKHTKKTQEKKNKIQNILEFCDLIKHKDKFPRVLSGGQQQRVAIARSLVANPNILLLDEAFGALDIKTRQKMQDLLLSIQKQLRPTIILVTHDIAEAVYLSDNIFIMSTNPGQIVEGIHVTLGERNRNTKKSPQFMEYVNYIDEKMMSLQN